MATGGRTTRQTVVILQSLSHFSNGLDSGAVDLWQRGSTYGRSGNSAETEKSFYRQCRRRNQSHSQNFVSLYAHSDMHRPVSGINSQIHSFNLASHVSAHSTHIYVLFLLDLYLFMLQSIVIYVLVTYCSKCVMMNYRCVC